MGYCYTRDLMTDRMVLCCDVCGNGGGVRKRPCPAGYCPATALCARPECKAKYKAASVHDGCREASKRFDAEEALKNAEPECWPRAAWGTWHTGTDDVLVLTRAETWCLVRDGEYNAGGRLPDNRKPWTEESGVPLPAGTKRVA